MNNSRLPGASKGEEALANFTQWLPDVGEVSSPHSVALCLCHLPVISGHGPGPQPRSLGLPLPRGHCALTGGSPRDEPPLSELALHHRPLGWACVLTVATPSPLHRRGSCGACEEATHPGPAPVQILLLLLPSTALLGPCASLGSLSRCHRGLSLPLLPFSTKEMQLLLQSQGPAAPSSPCLFQRAICREWRC